MYLQYASEKLEADPELVKIAVAHNAMLRRLRMHELMQKKPWRGAGGTSQPKEHGKSVVNYR